MADPQSLYDMDRTIRLSERAPSSLMCCACPVIARPACPLSGLFLFLLLIFAVDFSRGPSFPDVLSRDGKGVRRRIWMAYFRQAPGFLLPDLDGIDVSGWEVDEATGIVWQAAIGVPTALPGYPAALTEYYPPAFRSVDMVWGYKLEPLAAQRTRLTLVCQHDLRNWMVPNFLMNRMVGDVLADYVRTAERVGRKLVAEGKAAALRAKHGLE
jgi:hypothetical protein